MPRDNQPHAPSEARDQSESAVNRRDVLKTAASGLVAGGLGVTATGTVSAQSTSGPPFKMPNNDTLGWSANKSYGVHPAALAFDTQNRPYMVNVEGRTGDTVGHVLAYRNGGWTELDYTSALDSAGVNYDLNHIDKKERAWMAIDDDDDIYVTHSTVAGSSGGWEPCVLLYTSDFGSTWQVWEWNHKIMLEVNNGNNDTSVPPIIGYWDNASDYNWIDVYVPEKNNGVLDLGNPITITSNALGYSTHSGGHQWAITNSSTEAFVAYAESASDNPQYVARIDRQNKTVTDRVYVDNSTNQNGANRHCSPTMVKDYDGYIHYLVGTQSNNFKYYRSTQPGSVTDGWTNYELTGSSKSTYASLICDDQNRLHNVWHKDRWDPGDVYQRRENGSWNSGELFLEPPDDYTTGDYENYTQRAFADRDGGAIYYSYQFYHRGTSDNNYPRQLVVSTDGGQSWSAATTSGFSNRVSGGSPSQSPYGGTPHAIPGRIEAEDYDTGGEGVAYHDTTSGNTPGEYRTDNVDINTTTDEGGTEYNVGYVDAGEWLEYTVDVTSSGTYDLDLRVARKPTGSKSFHVEVDGTDVTGLVDAPSTGDWNGWTTVTVTDISLAAGQHVVRVYFDEGSINFNYMEWKSNQGPYGGSPHTIPGKIEAEDFDTGGEGVAYHDTDTGNNGSSSYRSTDVDMSEFATGEHQIGWIEPGEWLEYTVDVGSSGTYDLDLRVARKPTGSKTMHVEVDGTDVTGTITIPSTGGWSTHTTVTVTDINLNAGEHVVQLYFDEGSFNVDWMDWTANSASSDLTVTVNGSPQTFSASDFSTYSDQDGGSFSIQDGGDTLNLTGNTWQKIPLSHTIASNTKIEVEIESNDYGEIFAIGFDNDNDHWNTWDSSRTLFHLEGEQSPGDHIDARSKWTPPGPATVTLDVGNYYTGTADYLAFVADDDADASADVIFRSIRVYEA